MAIKLHDLRYIRRSPGEIAVLRELVSFQRCRAINPSEFWLAQMTNYEERQVRRILGKLRAAGLISYARHSRDFRGPNRPTNTYTLHIDKIQRLIDAGKVVVAKGLNAYYDQRAIPKHDRELPVRMSGRPTGQDVPQDVSLSIENLHPDKDGDYEPPHEEFDGEGSTEPSWEDVREMEEMHNNDTDSNINPCLQSSSSIHTKENLSTESLMIPKEYSYVPRTESPSTKPAYRLIISHLSGKVFRQYPDGHCEEAPEREQSAAQALE